MVAISKKSDQIDKEERKSDALLEKLLPPIIIPALKNNKVKSNYRFGDSLVNNCNVPKVKLWQYNRVLFHSSTTQPIIAMA